MRLEDVPSYNKILKVLSSAVWWLVGLVFTLLLLRLAQGPQKQDVLKIEKLKVNGREITCIVHATKNIMSCDWPE